MAAIKAHKVTKKAGVPDRERFAAFFEAIMGALAAPEHPVLAQAMTVNQRRILGGRLSAVLPRLAWNPCPGSRLLDDAHDGTDGKGIWLWTLAAGLLLFVMEFILFAALVPTDWARQVSTRELKSLVDAVGPAQADAILDRAVRWSGLLRAHRAGGVELPRPGPRSPDGGAGLEKLADSPVWPWHAGRVQVVCWSLGQACQRLAVLLFWWPFSLILCAAAAYDALLRRRIRQHSFSYASPLIHFWSVRALLWILIGTLMLLVAPIPLPATGVPVGVAVVAVLVGLLLANSQNRL